MVSRRRRRVHWCGVARRAADMVGTNLNGLMRVRPDVLLSLGFGQSKPWVPPIPVTPTLVGYSMHAQGSRWVLGRAARLFAERTQDRLQDRGPYLPQQVGTEKGDASAACQHDGEQAAADKDSKGCGRGGFRAVHRWAPRRQAWG